MQAGRHEGKGSGGKQAAGGGMPPTVGDGVPPANKHDKRTVSTFKVEFKARSARDCSSGLIVNTSVLAAVCVSQDPTDIEP